MPFDSTFLESFFNLQVEVASLREGFSEVYCDIIRMVGRVDSIEQAVTYFRGFVDRQNVQKERRCDEMRGRPFKRLESTRRGAG